MHEKIKLGETIIMSNPRTGFKNEVIFKIASDFTHPSFFGKMLAELYIDNYSLFRKYSLHLYTYINDKKNKISEIDKIQNISIIQGVNGFYLARDKDLFEKEEIERQEFNEQMKHLLATKK